MIYKASVSSYLTHVLSAVLNNKPVSLPPKNLEWSSFSQLSEEHRVSGTAYYALLGCQENITKEWKDTYSYRFRKAVTLDHQQKKEVERIEQIFERKGIRNILLSSWNMKNFYPQSDMRYVEQIEFLFHAKEEKQLVSAMRSIGYEYKGMNIYGDLFFSIDNYDWKVMFRRTLFAHNRKFRKFFLKIWDWAVLCANTQYSYQFSIENFYILLMSRLCDRYAYRTIDIRDIMDLYVYLKAYGDQLNRSYIDTELTALNICAFSKYLEGLCMMWFNEEVKLEEGTTICMDLEEYIFSKGAYGFDTSLQLLPMITDIDIWRLKDQRHTRVMKLVRWFFPELRYMEGIYSILEKRAFLLGFFWLHRLIRLFFYFIKARLVKAYHVIFYPINRLLSRFISWRERKKLPKDSELDDETLDEKENKN